MRFVHRALEKTLLEAARRFAAVVVTGPRRAGKTTLLRRAFPGARYVLLEDPDVRARAGSDPRALLEELKPPVLFDEIQNVPELFGYIRAMIDERPGRKGQWLFTGSQEAPLMQGVSESMAGRAAVLELLPLSVAETRRVSLLDGGYPEVVARPAGRDLWFSSYIQTYLERDVRSIVNVKDLTTFRRFLALVASRHGQMVNRSDLAAPLGVSVPTVSEWLRVLEMTGQVLLVAPYFENFGKRLVKTPKVYWGDSGMACHLLGIRSVAELNRSPFLGALFEGQVAAEIVKSQVGRGRRRELYYFRDQQGLEVDFLFPGEGGAVRMVECRAAKTVQPGMAKALGTLRRAMGERVKAEMTVVHRGAGPGLARGLGEGVEALGFEEFAVGLGG